MTDQHEQAWSEAIANAVDKGAQVVTSAEELNSICRHICQLLTDAANCLAAGSLGTAGFLAIAAIEETAKAHVGSFARGEPQKRHQDPFYRHEVKTHIATGPTVAMGTRLNEAIGGDTVDALRAEARSGGLKNRR